MAELVHHSLAFAPQTTTSAASLIPPGYRPDLYVSDLFKERPLVNLASQGTISNAAPFTVPKFSSVTTGSATHVEGTNPSDGSLAFTTGTVTPQAISGRIVLTRELVDSANPAIDQNRLRGDAGVLRPADRDDPLHAPQRRVGFRRHDHGGLRSFGGAGRHRGRRHR